MKTELLDPEPGSKPHRLSAARPEKHLTEGREATEPVELLIQTNQNRQSLLGSDHLHKVLN